MYDVTIVIVLVLIGLVLLYSSTVCNLSCGEKEAYGAYNDYCRWDSRRFCTLPNGDGGKCVMNGLCVPQMLMYEGADEKGTGWLNPDLRGHSPVAPTWRWKAEDDPSLGSINTLDDIEAQELRNDYSDAAVMDYVNLRADDDAEKIAWEDSTV